MTVFMVGTMVFASGMTVFTFGMAFHCGCDVVHSGCDIIIIVVYVLSVCIYWEGFLQSFLTQFDNGVFFLYCGQICCHVQLAMCVFGSEYRNAIQYHNTD